MIRGPAFDVGPLAIAVVQAQSGSGVAVSDETAFYRLPDNDGRRPKEYRDTDYGSGSRV